MSRSEGPFLVALHLTASQVMMKNSEGVLNAANKPQRPRRHTLQV
jgi:hypothetical protein